MTGEKLYSKAAVRKRLSVGRIRYGQLIESKILAQPICLVEGARAVHTESQIQNAETNIYRQALKDLQPLNSPKMKPLSAKMISEIR